MRIKHSKLGKIALVALIVFIAGGIGSVAVGYQAFSATPAMSNNETISLDGEKSASVEIDMGIGDLALAGGAEEMMTGQFKYSRKDDRPTIDYEVEDREGNLKINRKESSAFWHMDWFKFGENVRNDWDIQLNKEVPVALHISTGVGKSELDLSDLNLSDLELDAGVGDVELDLSGDYDRSFDVKIDSGVGEIDLILPDDIGVRLQVDRGVGSLEVWGLTLNGDYHENDAYKESDIKIMIDLEMGVGDVSITTLEQK